MCDFAGVSVWCECDFAGVSVGVSATLLVLACGASVTLLVLACGASVTLLVLVCGATYKISTVQTFVQETFLYFCEVICNSYSMGPGIYGSKRTEPKQSPRTRLFTLP